jgi:hypothetical protein
MDCPLCNNKEIKKAKRRKNSEDGGFKSFETLAKSYQSTLCYISEDLNLLRTDKCKYIHTSPTEG